MILDTDKLPSNSSSILTLVTPDPTHIPAPAIPGPRRRPVPRPAAATCAAIPDAAARAPTPDTAARAPTSAAGDDLVVTTMPAPATTRTLRGGSGSFAPAMAASLTGQEPPSGTTTSQQTVQGPADNAFIGRLPASLRAKTGVAPPDEQAVQPSSKVSKKSRSKPKVQPEPESSSSKSSKSPESESEDTEDEVLVPELSDIEEEPAPEVTATKAKRGKGVKEKKVVRRYTPAVSH